MTNYVRNNRGTRKANATKTRKFLGPWFRAYASDIDDYRLQCLPVQVRWIWFELSCIATQASGTLPDHEQMAFRLRRAPHEIAAAIDVLISSGLVIQDCLSGAEPTLRMAGWEQRQFVADRSAERMRRLREKKADRQPSDSTCDVTCDGESDDKTVVYSPLLSSLEQNSYLSIQEEDVDGNCLGDTCEGGAA